MSWERKLKSPSNLGPMTPYVNLASFALAVRKASVSKVANNILVFVSDWRLDDRMKTYVESVPNAMSAASSEILNFCVTCRMSPSA